MLRYPVDPIKEKKTKKKWNWTVFHAVIVVLCRFCLFGAILCFAHIHAESVVSVNIPTTVFSSSQRPSTLAFLSGFSLSSSVVVLYSVCSGFREHWQMSLRTCADMDNWTQRHNRQLDIRFRPFFFVGFNVWCGALPRSQLKATLWSVVRALHNDCLVASVWLPKEMYFTLQQLSFPRCSHWRTNILSKWPLNAATEHFQRDLFDSNSMAFSVFNGVHAVRCDCRDILVQLCVWTAGFVNLF